MSTQAFAAALAITVNQFTVHSDVPPLLDHGRVLLPARAVFSALGAGVHFDRSNKRVDIRRGKRFVRVTIGSSDALEGNRTIRLETPARIVRGRTFVPLRFVAEALGATVDYDAAAETVAILDPQAPSDETVTKAGASAAHAVRYAPPSVVDRRPGPGEAVTGAFPAISATISTHGGPAVDFASVRMFIDGRDVTDRIFHSGDAIGYTPQHELLGGSHEVTVQGADESGERFSSTWDFNSTYAYAQGPAVVGYPSWNGTAPFNFYVSGPIAYGYGNLVNLVLVGPPGGVGFVNLCGYGPQYPFVYGPDPNHYFATIPLPPNFFAPSCFVSGFFTDPFGKRTFLSLAHPIWIDTHVGSTAPTPLPSKRPSTAPTPLPPPTATPSPPSPSPKPTPTPGHVRKPHGAPTPPVGKPTTLGKSSLPRHAPATPGRLPFQPPTMLLSLGIAGPDGNDAVERSARSSIST